MKKKAIQKITSLRQRKNLLPGLFLLIAWIVTILNFYLPLTLTHKTIVKSASITKLSNKTLIPTPTGTSHAKTFANKVKPVSSNANEISPTISSDNSSADHAIAGSDTTGDTSTNQTSSSNDAAAAEVIPTITLFPTGANLGDNAANPTPTQDPTNNNAIITNSVNNSTSTPANQAGLDIGANAVIQGIGATSVSQSEPTN